MFEYKAKFLAPFNIEFTKKSVKFSVSKLLSLCAIFRSDKYVVISKSNYNYDFSPPRMGEVA